MSSEEIPTHPVHRLKHHIKHHVGRAARKTGHHIKGAARKTGHHIKGLPERLGITSGGLPEDKGTGPFTSGSELSQDKHDRVVRCNALNYRLFLLDTPSTWLILRTTPESRT